MLLVQIAIRLHNEPLALKELRRPGGFAFVSEAMKKSMELGILRRLGADAREIEALEDQIHALGGKGAHSYMVAGVTFYSLFDDYREAMKWFEHRRDASPPIDLVGCVLLFKTYSRLGMKDMAEAMVPRIRELDGTPYAKFAAEEIIRRARDEDAKR